MAWMLLSFWPALLLVSFTGEELLTDNLLLHWTVLFGTLLGLSGLALAGWLPHRILHMTATAGIGGGPTYVTAVARHQQEAGWQVRIFCSDEKPFVEIWQRMGLDVSILPMRRPSLSSVWRLLKELLRAPAPIHAHGRGAAFFAVWVKLLVRIPVIYTPHGPHYAYKRGWRYASSWCFEFLFRLVFDAVLYVSNGERETAQNHHLPVGRSLVVISGLMGRGHGTPAARTERETLLHEWNIPSDRFVIGWIGRFDYAKGLDLLVDSISHVAAHVSEAVWVVIGDGDHQGLRFWQDRVADLGQSGRVRFLGARADACDLIRAFDLFVSTSRWEGLPLVLLEVMEQAVPIAASDVIGNRDVLNGWGYLFPAHDIGDIAAAQIRLASDASLRARLAATGREIRRTHFSVTRMLTELDSAYQQILGVRLTG
jgi:glycosyltransferase involved in cell wall biosynthesis